MTRRAAVPHRDAPAGPDGRTRVDACRAACCVVHERLIAAS
jgi:hypothetical protein